MAITLPRPLEQMAARLLAAPDVDFSTPPGEAAVVPPDSVSWRVFANPVSMYVGGIAAVLLELAEPRVRHGVWDHSSFKRDPAGRLRRTGLAAMVTVYGARSRFEALAQRVRRMHGRVSGVTPEGQAYAASDPELLLWVQVTASWAFLNAYCAYAKPLPPRDRDLYYAEGEAGAALYGVAHPPLSEAAVEAVFREFEPKLGPTPILGELLHILRTAPILPLPLRPLQSSIARAAVDLLPARFQHQLGLERHGRIRPGEKAMLRAMARTAERVELASSPRAQARSRVAAGKGRRRSERSPDPIAERS